MWGKIPLSSSAAEWAIFAGVEGGEVIMLSSNDEVEGGEDGSLEGV